MSVSKTLLFICSLHVLQLGFLCPVLWLVCAFLPCYTKHNTKTDKSAATLSVVFIFAVVSIVVMKFGLKIEHGAPSRYSECYYYQC
jgi:hypothetical protein